MKPIIFPLKLQMKRPEVGDLQQALILLGSQIAEAELANQRYGASTRAAVLAFQTAHQLPATGVVDEATASVLNNILAESGALDDVPGTDPTQPTPESPPATPQDNLQFSVQGEVVRPDGTPLQDYRVRAFDRALCEWRQLREAGTNDLDARTDDRGRYRITYDPAQLKAWGKTRADLKVEVYDANTGDTLLAASPLIFEALPRERIDFSIGEGVAYRGPDEYTRVERALTPLLRPLNDLNCIELADVLILARESELANSSVAYYVKARRWSAELDLPPAVFYALLRRNHPTRLDALFARPLSVLWSALEAANGQNVINLPLNDALRARLNAAQRRYLAQPKHSYNQLLQTTSLKPKQQAVFTERLTAGTETGEAFWNALQTNDGFSVAQVSELQAMFEVQSFTGANTPLSIHLRSALKVRAPRDVAAFSLEQWRDTVLVAEGVGIPDDILPGATEAVRRAAYAQRLYRSAEIHYPTPSLAAQMNRSQFWVDQPVLGFLKKHPDFEFDAQRITFFLKDHPDAVNTFSDPVAGKQELLRIEQLFHLTQPADRLAAIEPLWQAGLRSAPQIAAAGRQQLLRQVSGRLDKPVATRIYQQALHTTALALNVYMRYHPSLNRLSLYALRTPQLPREQALARAARDLPEWSELFGSADACECSHCESTLSPAAYLVDQMDFLQRASDGAGKTALDYLLERRPDLGMLQLTCENTETELPQIDLVIEIMEQIVAFSSDGTTIPTIHVGQTTGDSELLAAQPENFEPAAYEKLRAAKFPFDHLPFDLWPEEGRRYLKQMGVERDELMQALPSRPGVGALEIATERLQMSTLEREIIATPNTRLEDLAACWGVDLSKGTLRVQLGPVENLLKQARIDYATLLRLLNTRYVNPDGLVAVTFAGDPCALDGAQLTRADGSELTGEEFRVFLDHLHRFMRLQRRTGWTEYELDMTLPALDVADFDARGFVPNLAAMQTLREAFDLPVSELCSWWNDLDTYVFEDDVPSQYAAIFLNTAVFPDTHSGAGPDLRSEVFALNDDQSDLVITASSNASLSPWLAESDGASEPSYSLQPDYAAYIQSATRLTSADLLLLVEEVLPKEATAGHVTLNLANVSQLYRIASFTQSLNLGIKDYLRLIGLTGIAPLATPAKSVTPPDTLELKKRFDEIDGGKLSLEQLAYLLLHETDAAVVLGPKTEDIDALLVQLNPAFIGIQDTADGTALEHAKADADLTLALTQLLGSTLGLDTELLNELLFTVRINLGRDLLANLIVAANPTMPSPPVASQPFDAVFETLHKFAIAWNALGLDASHLAFVMDSHLHLPDIAALPLTEQAATDFEAWRRLTKTADLQTSVFSIDQSLFALLKAAKTLSQDEYLAQASAWTGWSFTDLIYLTGPEGFNYTYPLAFQRPDWLLAVDAAFALLRPLGVSAAQAHAWTVGELTFAQTQSIKQALTLAYDEDSWLEVLAGIQDELRVLKRDALLDVLMNNFAATDSDDIYRHYLIDPKMQPCARTSRIVEAHAAVQLFAQRILLNLEPPLAFAPEDGEGWKWRKNYRVWEAARKVFLYPENWLESEWRDNKSEFFRELEDGLLQDDVNQTTAERLYRDYLIKLDRVSRLEIMGMYEDTEARVLHVFGRTRDIPGLYYYRRWEDHARWTSWERVGLDIKSDHLIPIVYNGRLYVFWPEFKVTEPTSGTSAAATIVATRGVFDVDSTGNTTPGNVEIPDVDVSPSEDEPSSPSGEQHPSSGPSAPLEDEIELRMAWSQYSDGAWTGKTLSTREIYYTTTDDLNRHYFTGWVSNDNRLHLALHGNKTLSGEGLTEIYYGYFYFDDCQGALLFSGDNEEEAIHPNGAVIVSKSMQKFQSLVFGNPTWSITRFELEVDGESSPRPLLGDIPTGGRFHYAHQYGLGGGATSPFFFSDEERTYFVRWDNVLAAHYAIEYSDILQGARAERAQAAFSDSTFAGGHYGGVSSGFISYSVSHQPYTFPIQENNALLDTLAGDPDPVFGPAGTRDLTDTRYVFTRFYQPYTCLFLKQLSRYGIDGLLKPDPDAGIDSETLYRQLTPAEDFDFSDTYDANSSWIGPNPNEEIDFDESSPYGLYNAELFIHIPLLIATRLMQNQRFSEARRWFHYIFDPTKSDGPAPACFWNVKPFYEEQLKGPTETLQELLDLLEQGSLSLDQQVQQWERDPFQPFAIARLRTAAYMQAVVMKYCDCLIGEGDWLFTTDQREQIAEAAQLYLLAAEVLGDKPTLLPAQEAPTLTPNILLGRFSLPRLPDILDSLSAMLRTTQPGIDWGHTSTTVTQPNIGIHTQGGTTSYGTLLLFCIPHNDKLYGYWETVADRLFKIRNCMNLAGQVRQLPLFSPPIDPALLIRATAAGLDIAAILSGLYALLPKYRFSFMLQKALEFCNEVRSLGGALLAALEKKDGEELSLLRSAHEVSLLKSVRELKVKSVEESESSLGSLLKSREAAEFRVAYYLSLERVSSREQKSLDKQEDSRHRQRDAEIFETTASILHIIPTFGSMGASFGGSHLGSAAQAFASTFRARSALHAYEANKAATMAGYDRREDDWRLQADLAKKEIEQLDKQILAAEIRLQIAEKDLANHDQQVAQAEEAEAFLKTKFTNQELYSWMLSTLSTLYFQAYQMADQLAKGAEKAFQHEAGPDGAGLTFITGAYWDSLKKGLLAGEELHHDLRRMETAHLEANRRELEITKHISLFQLDPAALLQLRQTGACDIHIPEVWFDMDYPGLYFRRTKAVRLTIPCVTGPYTNVNATLSLTQSWIRKAPDATAALEPMITVLPQNVIATSSAKEDSGTFELNFNDQRYLPFEGAGAISSWHLELPSAVRSFDYDTIMDVVVHLSYTALDGGESFKQAVNANLESALNDLKGLLNNSGVTLARLFSLRHEFAADWNRFLSPAAGEDHQITLSLNKRHFPRYLDYLWEKNIDGIPEPHPITLRITAVKVYLNPKGMMPPNARNIRINGKTRDSESDIPGLLFLNSAPDLSTNEISNESGAELNLTVSDVELSPEDWKDMYVLLTYEITA